jgi:hypothetical protein
LRRRVRNTEPIDDEEGKIWFDRHGMVLAHPPCPSLFLPFFPLLQ